MIQQSDLNYWLESPVTRELVKLLAEHSEASELMVSRALLNCRSIADVDMHVIAEYKGQTQAFKQVLDLKEFLDEAVERKEEVQNEEDDSIR